MTDDTAALIVELQLLRSEIAVLPMAIVMAIQDQLVLSHDAPPVVTVGCPHPEDQRVPLGGGDWQCGIATCQHFHKFQTEGAPV
jgi:hypothetical protein